MKKKAILLLVIFVLIMSVDGGGSLAQDFVAGDPLRCDSQYYALVFCNAWGRSLQTLFSFVDQKDNSYWLNQLNQSEIKDVANEAVGSCNSFISEWRSHKLVPNDVKGYYLNLTRSLEMSLKKLDAAVGKNNGTGILNSLEAIKDCRRKSEAIRLSYAAAYRDGLMPVIEISVACCESFIDLRMAILGESEKLESVSTESIVRCNKFILKYHNFNFQPGYLGARNEYLTLTRHMERLLEEIIKAIDNKDMAALCNLCPIVLMHLEQGDMLQKTYARRLCPVANNTRPR